MTMGTLELFPLHLPSIKQPSADQWCNHFADSTFFTNARRFWSVMAFHRTDLTGQSTARITLAARTSGGHGCGSSDPLCSI